MTYSTRKKLILGYQSRISWLRDLYGPRPHLSLSRECLSVSRIYSPLLATVESGERRGESELSGPMRGDYAERRVEEV